MSAQYLVRFDDVCPTMNWPIWQKVEKILLDFDVKPILSVVPDNQDERLKVSEPRHNFWGEVRAWQQRGWTIGLHGYQHRYVTWDSGIVGINRYSEFSCLSLEEQSYKMQHSLEIFEREGVKPDVWVAPGHSFDETTLKVLRSVGIKYVSDGLFPFPHLDSTGVLWVPQQFWRFRYMPFGVWTIDYHINQWNSHDIKKLRADLRRFRQAIVRFADVVRAYSSRRSKRFDAFYARLHLSVLKAARMRVFRELRELTLRGS